MVFGVSTSPVYTFSAHVQWEESVCTSSVMNIIVEVLFGFHIICCLMSPQSVSISSNANNNLKIPVVHALCSVLPVHSGKVVLEQREPSAYIC